MTVFYLDADGPLRFILEASGRDPQHTQQLQREARAMSDFLRTRTDEDVLISTELLRVEIMRTLCRQRVDRPVGQAFLDSIKLTGVSASDYRHAAQLPMRTLRSLDALHLSAALRLQVDVLVSYDKQLISAASEVGLQTLSPGAE